MIILTLFLSFFSWGNDCQFHEGLSSFNVQCENTKALWVQTEVNEAQFSVHLSQKMKISLVFGRRLNGDYSLLRFNVDKGHRLYPWLNDRDIFYLKKLNQTIQAIDFQNEEINLFKTSSKYFLRLPLYESLKELEIASKQKVYAGYRMICKYIGKRKRGYYQVDGKKYSKREWVGRQSNGCFGRCGVGCSSTTTQYTQECLNHDVCAHTMDENLGVCSDEFWAASDGYLFAPNCE